MLLKSFLLLSFFINFLFCEAQIKKKTIVFVGAHPDDETAISEVLTKYAQLGNKVYVIIATDGKDGTRVTKIPAGDSLGSIRKQESICGCKRLGIEPPIFFGIERLDTRIGVRNYFNAHHQFMDSLKNRIQSLQPDILITTGPDGDTHHAEHIVVGSALTELLLMEGWVEKYPLYYFGWTKEASGLEKLGYVDQQYFNVKVVYTTKEKEIAIEAIRCYESQYTPEEMNEETLAKRKEKTNTIYFRRFVVAKGMKNEFN